MYYRIQKNIVNNNTSIDADKIHRNAIASLTDKPNEKVEKLFILPNDNFEAVDFTSMGVVNENANMLPKFIEGERYSLQGVACDGFTMPNKTYELIGVVDNFHGVNVDYVIMKQIDGDKGQIYSFSKNDCAHLGIEYQDGLQPFPKNMHWKRVKEKIEFNKDDLSTTPRSEVDNSIRHVLLRIDGFKDYSDGYVLSPSGKLIKEDTFEKSLRIINNEPIVYGNGFVVKDKTKLNAKIAYPNGLLYNHANFISQDDTVYVLITLKQTVTTSKQKKLCIDDGFGIEPRYLTNIDPHNLFTIAWDEFGCLTVQEYEEAKEKAKKKALEKAKKLEEERKKRIEEEESRKKEENKRRIEAVERMKKTRIKTPSFPMMPSLSFKTDNIATVDMFANSMSRYFGELDKTLETLSNDLENMFPTYGNRPTHKRKLIDMFDDLLVGGTTDFGTL